MTSPPRPTPGNYRSPAGNTPRKDSTAPEKPVEKKSASKPPPTFIPASMVNVMAAAKTAPGKTTPSPEPEPTVEVEPTPTERYRKRLDDAKIPWSTANGIFDAVMSKDYYEEYVKVGQNRAVFRTRMYEDHLRLQTALELHRPGLVLSQEDMITRYNLAASLYEWRGTALAHENDDDFDTVLNLIMKMPAPLYSLLTQKLAQFDQKVMTVFSDGATDSF